MDDIRADGLGHPDVVDRRRAPAEGQRQGVPGNQVVAVAAVYRVVAGKGEGGQRRGVDDARRPAAAHKSIAGDGIVAGPGDDAVAAGIGPRLGLVEDADQTAEAAVQQALAGNQVVPGTTEERVRTDRAGHPDVVDLDLTGRADQGRAIAGDHVVAVIAVEQVVAGPAEEGVIATVGDAAVAVAVDRVVAITGIDQIIPAACDGRGPRAERQSVAGNQIVTIAAEYAVVTAVTDLGKATLGKSVAGDFVGAGAGQDKIRAGTLRQSVEIGHRSAPALRQCVPGDQVVARAAVDGVAAGTRHTFQSCTSVHSRDTTPLNEGIAADGVVVAAGRYAVVAGAAARKGEVVCRCC